MAAACGIERRDAHQTVNARFTLQKAISIFALDKDGSALQARFVALKVIERRNLKAVTLTPTVVHTEQHLGPVLCLRAAGTRMERQNRVLTVIFAGEKRCQTHRLNLFADGLHFLLCLRQKRKVFFLIAHFNERQRIFAAGNKVQIRLVLLL